MFLPEPGNHCIPDSIHLSGERASREAMGLGAQESDLVYRLDTDVAPEGGRDEGGGREKLRDPQYAHELRAEQVSFVLFLVRGETIGRRDSRRRTGDNPLCWRVEGGGLTEML